MSGGLGAAGLTVMTAGLNFPKTVLIGAGRAKEMNCLQISGPEVI